MEKMEEKACLCALNRIFGFTPKTGLALISHIGSASGIFSLSHDELSSALGKRSSVTAQITASSVDKATAELERLKEMGIGFVGWTEDEYPDLLRECEDAPVGLYVRSDTPMQDLWLPQRRIAVVGTRDISPYGREWCQRTVSALSCADDKPVVISGLALGTDFLAHRTALEYGLPTIAVMATGPDDVYPARHRDFAEKIARTPRCALITDYPPGTVPMPVNFLRRNRIIAGLSDSTILIESKIKGGGMMTSRLAFSYNREVYALPGRADDIRSQGCNQLIKSKIAEPITSTDELIDSLGLKCTGRREISLNPDTVGQHYKTLSEDRVRNICRIMALIRKRRGISIEDVAVETGLSYGVTSDIIGMLEMDGFISLDLLQRCMVNIKKI